MINKSITKLRKKMDLTCNEVDAIMNSISNESIHDQKTALILKLLSIKGESDNELLWILKKMQEFCINININNENAIDVCGTGGDKKNTFNISTAAAFVIAATGVTIAKHGNRSHSGMLGSADLFEYFGYDLNGSAELVSKVIKESKIGFMFAQRFHPIMKKVHNARKIANMSTVFNIIGPICNPAHVRNQLIGVHDNSLIDRLPEILKKSGSKNIMAVRSADGLDEISTTSNNHICLLKNGLINTFTLNPQRLGLKKINLSEIQVTTKSDAISAFVSVLNNTAKKSLIEITAINAAGGLIISGITNSFSDAINIALDTIKNEKPYKLFKRFLLNYGNIKKLEYIQ